MRRGLSVFCVIAMIVTVLPLTAAAQTTAVFVTDASYTSIAVGAQYGVFAYTTYEADGTQKIGTMNAEGELTREAFSPERWEEIFPDEEWAITVHGDAASFCPYAHTHISGTICPYNQVAYVTMHNKKTDVTIENVYVSSTVSPLLPDGTIHICLGKYGFVSPETLRYTAGQRYAARRGENGFWGVFDMQRGVMITTYRYADMCAFYGDYAKVFNGKAWGRLDLSGRMPLVYAYNTAEAFSVREEVRAVDGGWQVFSKDNEPMSPIIVGEYTDAEYAADAAVVLLKAADGTTVMVDLLGNTVATFTKRQTVSALQGDCFAVTNTNVAGAITGVALLRVDGAPTAKETIAVGDVDFNGVIDTADARLILTAVIGNVVLSERQIAAADVDGDTMISTADAREALRAAISA